MNKTDSRIDSILKGVSSGTSRVADKVSIKDSMNTTNSHNTDVNIGISLNMFNKTYVGTGIVEPKLQIPGWLSWVILGFGLWAMTKIASADVGAITANDHLWNNLNHILEPWNFYQDGNILGGLRDLVRMGR